MEITIRGNKAMLDDEDWDKISGLSWSILRGRNTKYATHQKETRGKVRHTLMHHLILGKPPKGMVTDHINGDGLDNRKSNLRFCTVSENAMNSKLPSNNTSGHRGVFWNKRLRKWAAQIQANQKTYYLGVFQEKTDAIQARAKMAKALHGDFMPTEVDE